MLYTRSIQYILQYNTIYLIEATLRKKGMITNEMTQHEKIGLLVSKHGHGEILIG